jgi:hypothetical protein
MIYKMPLDLLYKSGWYKIREITKEIVQKQSLTAIQYGEALS